MIIHKILELIWMNRIEEQPTIFFTIDKTVNGIFQLTFIRADSNLWPIDGIYKNIEKGETRKNKL